MEECIDAEEDDRFLIGQDIFASVGESSGQLKLIIEKKIMDVRTSTFPFFATSKHGKFFRNILLKFNYLMIHSYYFPSSFIILFNMYKQRLMKEAIEASKRRFN